MIWTYQDAVEHVMDVFDVDDTDRNRRLCRRAVDEVYREMPQRARWTYFDRRWTLQTSAPYSTGTVSFDLEGGTYPRQLTLSGGTWPTWAKYGRIIQPDLIHDVQERISDTVLILDEATAPTADFTDQTYSINRFQYDLPEDCRRVMRVYSQEKHYMIPIATIDQIRDSNLVEATTSTPWKVAVHGSPDTYGRQSLAFNPVPSDAKSFDIWYEAHPRSLRYYRESLGTVTASSTTVTGTGTAFESNMVGSIIRFSSNGNQEPTPFVGMRNDNGLLNPFVHEARIIRYVSATSIVIDAAPSSSLTDVKYVIGDPIEIRQGAMWTAFLRGAEHAFSRLVNDKRVNERGQEYYQALRLAMEDDQVVARTDTYPIVGPGPKILTR